MADNREWNESLFGCCDDYGICCRGCLLTPGLFGSNAKKIDDSNCCLMCCAYLILSECYLCWIPHLQKRKILREKYGLREDPECPDCPATVCCGPCALCQEARFLKNEDTRKAQNVASPHTTQPGKV